MEEETGISGVIGGRVVGVYSAPDRDPRFHAILQKTGLTR